MLQAADGVITYQHNGVDTSILNRSREWARAIFEARAARTVMLIKKAIAEKKSS